jgi:hypothetical protein
MTRSLLPVLALSCVFVVGCPGATGDDSKPIDSSGDSGPDSVDVDGDGYTIGDGDCNDEDPSVNPAAEEICDGNDNDCDGEIDEDGATTYFQDADGDGFGDADISVVACEPEAGWVANSDDCDDLESSVYPGADEECDGLDNDCDGTVDDGLTTTYYRDADGDGYGDPEWSVDECSAPGAGWVTNTDDCNDAEPTAYNGATEACDGVDNDCNGVIDDGLSTTWYPDMDGDGYGDDSAAMDSCVDPGAGYLTVGGDCDDTEALAWTGASEYCDDVDNDCNGLVDDSALDATAQVADDDGDGFGSPTAMTWACEALVDNTLDCDDSTAREPQVVDDSASSSSADGSMANPWTTIQEGIDNARMCVAVMDGTYYENVDYDGNDVAVFSMNGWESTVIDGGGAGAVVTFQSGETSGASLDGFTVQNGGGALATVVTVNPDCDSASICTTTVYTYSGGGIMVDGAAPTLTNLWVTANNLPAYSYTEISSTEFEYVYSYGGGIYLGNTSGMEISGVTVDWNYADMGGGVYAASSASAGFSQGRINYNEATSGGGYVASGGTFDLTNAIVASNWAGGGGGAYISGGSSTWWNVSAAANSAFSGAGVYGGDGGSFYFYSSTISGSESGEGVYGDGTLTFGAEYSNVYGSAGADYSGVTNPTGSTGNISVDPMFTSWTDDNTDNDDLSLAAGSSLINAGNPSSAYNDTDATRNDIGAYGGPGGSW